MQPEDTICYCFHISKRKIVNFVRVHKPKRASQISECGGAGTGCGWCVPYLQRYFAEQQAAQAALQVAAASIEPGVEISSADEYARARAAYIQAGKGKPAAGALPLPPPAE